MGRFWTKVKDGVWGWILAYLGVIITFACLYSFLPDVSWKGDGRLDGFVDCIYFSVVTITSLGFGDIFPNESILAKIFVSTESIAGILIIGLFLNDVAHKQATRLDERNKKAEEEKMAAAALKKLDTYRQILKPVFDRYLLGIYMLITPFKDRINFNIPEGVINHVFNFQFHYCPVKVD